MGSSVTTSTSTNLDHARTLRERARAQAGGTTHRAALLVAAVALAESTSINGARRMLSRERLDDNIRARAQALLNKITGEAPHRGSARPQGWTTVTTVQLLHQTAGPFPQP